MSTNWPHGVDRRVFDQLDSTNSEAARLATTLAGPTWIMTQHQTAARGRRGRAWAEPPGNFAATLVMRPGGTPAEFAQRSFVASLALFDALVTLSGRAEPFALKWPNDVLLNGGKLAGILLESPGDGVLSIGIGVNLCAAPGADEVEPWAFRPVSLLGETGTGISPGDMLDHLAPAFAVREAAFTTYGFAVIREAWLARAARLGEVITARTGNTEITGTFETIDDTGALILSTARGRQAIPAADIFF